MNISILIPHYKTGMMTAYTISQLLKHKGNHKLAILISDNNAGDGSVEYLKPFKEFIRVVDYPKDKLQSHGVSLDALVELVETDYFIAIESDSFPTQDGWLDYYEDLINKGYDCAGSLLKLSGGTYLHPAGALYKTSLWREAKKYCDTIPYAYFPNMAMRDGFASHLMVHYDIILDFLSEPEDYVELADGYKPYSAELAREKERHYSPVCNPFHNGMGGKNESVKTYGNRTVESEAPTVILDKMRKLIFRVGAEPGQWLSWYSAAMGKKIFYIPTQTKWIEGRENQQQEYTINEVGFKHLWAVSAYHDYTPESEKDIALYKQSIPQQLYNTLPKYQQIIK